ncbi:MAG: hypothetical protein ACRD3W_32115, partial [Terriglobales bacterium]
ELHMNIKQNPRSTREAAWKAVLRPRFAYQFRCTHALRQSAAAAIVCSSLLPVFAVQSAQAVTATVTPVYCESDGSSGLPEGGVDQFINVSGRGLCLNFGAKSQDESQVDCWIGGRVDNVVGQPINNITFRLYKFNKTWANQLFVLMYFKSSKGDTVYAYAYGSSPTSSKTLQNGDTQLTFLPAAFATIPSGVSLKGATIKNLQIGMNDSVYYGPASYTMYGLTLNGSSVVPKAGKLVKDCTF